MVAAPGRAEPLSIVAAHDAIRFGGMEVYLLGLLERLGDRGNRVALLVPGFTDPWRASPSELVERARAGGIDVVRPDPPGTDRLAATARETVRTRALIARVQPDVVHVHTCRPQGGRKATLAAWSAGIPVVRTEHCSPTLFGGPKPGGPGVRITDRLTRRLLTVSEHNRQEQVEVCGRRADRIATSYTGIDLGGIELEGHGTADAKRAVGLDPTRRLVGVVGRLTEVKGHAHLVAAMVEVASTLDDVDLLVVGGGELESALRAQVAAAGLDGRVHLVGFRPDPRPHLRAMDVTVLPSRSEGLPLVLLEYMAHGKPAVVSDLAPLREAAGDTALFAPFGDAAELARCLLDTLGDPEAACARGRAARRRVEERFDLDRHVDELTHVYRAVARGGRRGRAGRSAS
jgi:glycosyltransferase involved in cell wall biosynthesis